MHTRIFTADLLLVVGTSLWVSTHLDEIDEMDDQTEQEMTFAFYSAFVAFIGLIVLTNGLEFKPPPQRVVPLVGGWKGWSKNVLGPRSRSIENP